MDVKIYTDKYAFNQYPNKFVYRNFDYILLLIVAVTGLICSAYALSSSSPLPEGMSYYQVAAYDAAKKSDFDKYVKIDGERKKGAELNFTINLDIKAKRYVMEMGDGRRMILTATNFSYKYEEKGDYRLELKQIDRGLISLMSDKTLKIKE